MTNLRVCFIQSLSNLVTLPVGFHWFGAAAADTLILWNFCLSSTWRWTSYFSNEPKSRMLHLKSCTFDRTTHTSSKLKRIKALWCGTTAVQIVRETTNCYVRSHLLWSKIRLYYSTFFSPQCFLMWGQHFVALSFFFVVSWRNLTYYVKNKVLLFLLNMTLIVIWHLIVSDGLTVLMCDNFMSNNRI